MARVAAVREALGPAGRIRVDANGAWSVDEAVVALTELSAAAGGLEYAEQPCATIAELAEVRRRTDVPIAADESIRLAADPAKVALAGAADVAVLKVAPLGGAFAALRVALTCGLPVVVSSAIDTSVGLAAGLALAGALPELPLRLRPGDRRAAQRRPHHPAGDAGRRQPAGAAVRPRSDAGPARPLGRRRADHPVLARPTAPGGRSAPVAAGREPGAAENPVRRRGAPVLRQ